MRNRYWIYQSLMRLRRINDFVTLHFHCRKIEFKKEIPLSHENKELTCYSMQTKSNRKENAKAPVA